MLLFALILNSLCTPSGVHYKYVTTDVPQSIHVLEVDPDQATIVAAKALDQSIGRETVLSLCQRKKALAGFNGGFFATGNHDGAPCGILKINNRWYGLPCHARGAIGWKDGGKTVLFDRVLTHQEGIKFCVDAQNRHNQWDEMISIIGGAPLLIRNGKKIDDFAIEETSPYFLQARHARTAVGTLANGHWIFVVVDGRQPTLSVGMTMRELADFMEDLGCINALNLDGGGSTTFVYENQVINSPTGDGDDQDNGTKRQRPVSDAIMIY